MWTPALFLIAGAVSFGAGISVFGIARNTRRRNPTQFFPGRSNGPDAGRDIDLSSTRQIAGS
jgi:hypothetical protein